MRVRYLAALVVPVVLHAQVQPARDSVITVSSQRITHVTADRASFYVVIEGVAETPTDAVARVQGKVGPVTDALHRVAPQAHVDRPVAYGVGPTQNLTGYPGPTTPATHTARSVIHVEIDHPEQVASIVAAAIGAGASSATGLTFELTSADSVRRAHVPECLAEARADAQAIATAMQGNLGSIVDVSLGGNPVIAFSQSSILSFDQRFTPQSAAPEVSVSTNVTVRYRLVR